MRLGTLLVLGLFLAGTASLASADEKAVSPLQVLERMHATYAGLNSYADRGRVRTERQSAGASLVVEEHHFTTLYAAPRRFRFDFRRAAGAERLVIWCPGDTFHSWWSATGVHEQYPQGEGATAFAVSAYPTFGSVLLLPALLFQQARLQSPLLGIEEALHQGIEIIAGRPHHKLVAAVRQNHWSGTRRQTSVWIDTDTYLVRKVLEDTPSGLGSGEVDRTTTIIEPEAMPSLSGSAFQFSPPP